MDYYITFPSKLRRRCTARKHVSLTKTNNNNRVLRVLFYFYYNVLRIVVVRTKTWLMRRDWNTEKRNLAHYESHKQGIYATCNLPQTLDSAVCCCKYFSLELEIVSDTICDIFRTLFSYRDNYVFRYDVGIMTVSRYIVRYLGPIPFFERRLKYRNIDIWSIAMFDADIIPEYPPGKIAICDTSNGDIDRDTISRYFFILLYF